MTSGFVTVSQFLAQSEALLLEAGVDSARLSAQVLAAHCLEVDRHMLLLDRARVLTGDQLSELEALVERRAKGEPVAYIVGSKEFYGLDFHVCRDVLIPRPETEHVVEEAESCFSLETPLRFADMGTGSGCLAVTLATRFPKAHGLALDSSPGALAVAAQNARHHGVQDRVAVVQADFCHCFALPCSLDLVVSNPPYVSAAEYREVSPEVAGFEPRQALVPDASAVAGGLECYEGLLPWAAHALRSEGMLLMEMGWLQAQALSDLVCKSGLFSLVRVQKDLAGKDRILVARRI